VPFGFPAGIAVEADGHLVVTDVGLNVVLRVDPDTGDRSIVSDTTTGRGAPFASPVRIAMEADGHLVVVDSGLQAVIRVDPTSGDRTLVSR
jgi:streptogramin lyase